MKVLFQFFGVDPNLAELVALGSNFKFFNLSVSLV